MDEFISRKKLKNAIQRNLDMQDLYLPIEFLELIDEAPAADVRPVVPARWIPLDIYKSDGNYKCSHCNQPCYVPECMGEPMYAFCPNCGADMRGDSEHE